MVVGEWQTQDDHAHLVSADLFGEVQSAQRSVMRQKTTDALESEGERETLREEVVLVDHQHRWDRSGEGVG
jgi:hypothetical protein